MKSRLLINWAQRVVRLLTAMTIVFLWMGPQSLPSSAQTNAEAAYGDSRPYTRWWWHAGKYSRADIRSQLLWLRDQGFGGVEVAFIYPVNRNPRAERFAWLGKEWQDLVVYAKHCADSLGMGCDFTYGSLWPYGGTFVKDEDRTRRWGDTAFRQPLRLTWEHPDTGNVLNHLDSNAFHRYAAVLSPAFTPALKGRPTALFCDSWEVETNKIWTPGFENIFLEQFGYDIRSFMDRIYEPVNAGPRYDYMKLVSRLVLDNFYKPWHRECRRMGALSRAQVAGAPVDILEGYAIVDVPETEAMLYEPAFGSIVSSAAALAGKPVVSAESFTCLYGWPRKYMFAEQTADLKLVADALFAHGVNQIVWHGTPLNPVGVDTIYFYATVHVGKRGNLSHDLRSFNEYLTRVSQAMRYGQPYSHIAVYLPQEDAWIAGELPKELQMPWSWGAYEMRYIYFPEELAGYHPLWVNRGFLQKGVVKKGKLIVNDLEFSALYVDAQHLDLATLETLSKLATDGLPIILKKIPAQAGYRADERFGKILAQLLRLPNVFRELSQAPVSPPVVEGESLPDFCARVGKEGLRIFFANPLAKNLKYPLSYGQSYQEGDLITEVIIHFNGYSIPLRLVFESYQSLLLDVRPDGRVEFHDIRYTPPIPSRTPPR